MIFVHNVYAVCNAQISYLLFYKFIVFLVCYYFIDNIYILMKYIIMCIIWCVNILSGGGI